ncbi:MAG: DUF1934 domain-containing protein [Clostridia bacterium]|nr:DUF1934 domain-containing protein [Clostridia bacterium]
MKKEKQVKIKIFAVVVRGEGEDADKDNIRITSEGTMSFDGKRVEICYVEMMGEEGAAHNTLSFDVTEPNIVTLVREGAVSCVMTFSENGRYGGLYNMGFASFDFTVATKRISNKLSFEKGGVLLLDYNTELQGIAMQNSRFRFDISVLQN